MTAARVLHVVAAGEIGGAERMLCDLATRVEATRAVHAVALLTPSDALEALLRDAGLRLFVRGRVREDPAAFLWRTLGPVDVAWLARVARAYEASVLHLHTFASQMLGTRAARRVGAAVVRTEHSTRVFDDMSCWPFSRWSLARADASVAISEHVRDVALARAPWARGRMRVIRNGVDLERFAPAPWPDEPAGDGGHLALAMVGRLDARKGIDRALRALARVPAVHLDIAGEGTERQALEALARSRGVADRVRFLGYLSDPRPVVRRSHAVLTASRTEGLGMANLEAMAMCRPVIGLATGGVREIVTDGVTGLAISAGADTDGAAEDSLVQVLERAMADRPRLAVLGASAREFIEQHASVTAMCRAYGDLYEAIRAVPG